MPDSFTFCGAANYNGPFYSASGAQLGTWTGGFPRITSTAVLQQVTSTFAPSPSNCIFSWTHRSETKESQSTERLDAALEGT